MPYLAGATSAVGEWRRALLDVRARSVGQRLGDLLGDWCDELRPCWGGLGEESGGWWEESADTARALVEVGGFEGA
jgi:hypothetical protein